MKRIYLLKNGASSGPFTAEEVVARFRDGELSLETLACEEGGFEWVSLSSLELPGLRGLECESVDGTQEETIRVAIGDRKILCCAYCGKAIREGMRFCSACGRSVEPQTAEGGSGRSERRGEQPHKGHYSTVRRYTCNQLAFNDLISALASWLDAQNFDHQTLRTQDGKTLLQISKNGGWRKIVGMSTALNVLLGLNGTALTVEIGAGRWIDKAAVGMISLFILWPLLATAAIGAWVQFKMPEKVFAFIEQQLGQRR